MAVPYSNALRDRVETALDGLRPALIADGGNVELLDVAEDGTVCIVLQGACAHCPAQSATVRFGLEAALRAKVPEVTAVVAAQAGEPR
jgi:Fe-S cluster biogenesis protein NfuA